MVRHLRIKWFPVAILLLLIGLLAIPLTMSHDRAELFLSYIKALAWPIGLVTVGYILRDRIGSLVDRLRSAEIPGGKFEFIERIEAAAQATTVAAVAVQQSAKDFEARLEILKLLISRGNLDEMDAESLLRRLGLNVQSGQDNAGSAEPQV